MNTLILGANGQVGRALSARLSNSVALSRDEADLERPKTVLAAIETHRPDVIVNAAAYTNVDGAESDRGRAWAINGEAPGVIGAVAKDKGILVVHYSSDYVYPGAGTTAQDEGEPTGPLSVYGESKLAGDLALIDSGADHIILRTSWVYAPEGKNFPLTILRLAKERSSLNVVADQFGAPTPAGLIADVTANVIEKPATGVFHLAPNGETSWHGIATHLVDLAIAAGAGLALTPSDVKPILASEYPTKALRPANSRLATTRLHQTFGIDLPNWQAGIHDLVATLKANGQL